MASLCAHGLRLGQVSAFLSPADQAMLPCLCVLMASKFEQKAKALVEQAGTKPVLVSYSSDPSALLLSATATSTAANKSVFRKGRVLVEFLLQRVLYKFLDEAGQPHLELVLGMPVPLSEGKAAPVLFGAATQLCPMVRKWGHEGIILQHLVCDRGIHTALETLMRSRMEAFYDEDHGAELGDSREFLQLQEVWFSTPCAAHAAQNSIKWCLPPWCSSDTFHNLHVCIESLRNSFSFLQQHLWSFLQRHLRIRSEAHSEEVAHSLWSALGVEAPMLSLFTEVHPVWQEGALHVGQTLSQEPDVMNVVSHAILYLFRWRKFTESRFTSLGTATRALMASVVAGLPALVELTRDDPHCSDFHLRGTSKLDQSSKHAAALIALATWPAETFTYELMEDDRLGRRPEAVRQLVNDEVTFLMSLPDGVWEILATSIGNAATGPGLRSDVCLAALTSVSFIHSNVFHYFDELPWSLAMLDKPSMLQGLAEIDVAGCVDSLTTKMAKLLALGYDENKISEAFMLMREASWSSMGVEQQHGSCASMRRTHPEYGAETLAQRAFLHSCRHLFHQGASTVADVAGSGSSSSSLTAEIRSATAKGASARQGLWIQHLCL